MTKIRRSTVGRFVADSGATAAIEFAIGGPMLVVLLIGMTEIALASYQSMQVQNAVEVGALYAEQNGWNPSGISGAVAAAAGTTGISATPAPSEFCGCPGVGGISPITCSAQCAGGASPGTYVQVNASLARASVFGGSGFALPDTLTATTIVRIN